MHAAAVRKGSDIVELAIMEHRSALHGLKIPNFMQMSDINAEGFLHHANAKVWHSDALRAAHTDILQALQSSKFALFKAAASYTKTVDSMVELMFADYSNYSAMVLSNIVQYMDEQATDITLRTCMPQGYVYFFVCMVVYYRLVCEKQLELLT